MCNSFYRMHIYLQHPRNHTKLLSNIETIEISLK